MWATSTSTKGEVLQVKHIKYRLHIVKSTHKINKEKRRTCMFMKCKTINL